MSLRIKFIPSFRQVSKFQETTRAARCSTFWGFRAACKLNLTYCRAASAAVAKASWGSIGRVLTMAYLRLSGVAVAMTASGETVKDKTSWGEKGKGVGWG